jgi:hypothetical protein
MRYEHLVLQGENYVSRDEKRKRERERERERAQKPVHGVKKGNFSLPSVYIISHHESAGKAKEGYFRKQK